MSEKLSNMKGAYGFLTDFDVSEERGRQMVRMMTQIFGIREFQFYDVFMNYSVPVPVSPASTSWISKPSYCFTDKPRVIRKATVVAMTEEIRKLGGRSW